MHYILYISNFKTQKLMNFKYCRSKSVSCTIIWIQLTIKINYHVFGSTVHIKMKKETEKQKGHISLERQERVWGNGINAVIKSNACPGLSRGNGARRKR